MKDFLMEKKINLGQLHPWLTNENNPQVENVITWLFYNNNYTLSALSWQPENKKGLP